jgi:outer membrane protein OmpA-like peptidoglycan-associated protein
MVQRWSGFEHEQLGDATGATIDIGGVQLTWGQVVAIAGDEYATVEDLRRDVRTDAGKARLRARLEHAGVRAPIDGALQFSHPDDAGRSNSTYVGLALENVSHFAAGGTARETWQSHHHRALAAAILSGLDADPGLWQEAQLVEAFGQHFLTDMFSAGHVRTPRRQIIDWYAGTFAPRTLPRFVASARQRLVEELTDQLNGQLLTLPRPVIQGQVEVVLRSVIGLVMAFLQQEALRYFGLGVAGAVSGVLHDRDNERGLWVASEAHPDPWFTFGDNRLGCSPETRNQAELAMLTARERLVRAQALGRQRRDQRGAEPSPAGQTGGPTAVPGVVHFGFNSNDLDPASAAALGRVAGFLLARPEQVVDLVGHTDPLGTDGYNLALGTRRAEAAQRWLVQTGVDPSRITVASAGESRLVSTEVGGYPANRRCELHFRSIDQPPPDLLWAQQTLATDFRGPPYPDVERYLPHEVPELNDPQEQWQWGLLSSTMASDIEGWIGTHLAPFKAGILANPYLRDQIVPWPVPLSPVPQPVTIRPQVIVAEILTEFLATPVKLLEDWFGEPAANHSTEPPPKPTPCP